MSNVLAIDGVKVTFAEGQVVNSVEKIRFSDPVRAGKTIDAFGQNCLIISIILEIKEVESFQKHAAKLVENAA